MTLFPPCRGNSSVMLVKKFPINAPGKIQMETPPQYLANPFPVVVKIIGLTYPVASEIILTCGFDRYGGTGAYQTFVGLMISSGGSGALHGVDMTFSDAASSAIDSGPIVSGANYLPQQRRFNQMPSSQYGGYFAITAGSTSPTNVGTIRELRVSYAGGPEFVATGAVLPCGCGDGLSIAP